jgi:hypothetical protein
MPKPQIQLDPSKNLKQWVFFPDIFESKRFKGFEDLYDPTLSRGAFVVGENMKIGADSLPITRSGYEVMGTEAANATPVMRAWVFETRNGVIWELKAYSTRVDYWLHGTSTDWALLKGGFTTGLEFGFGNIGETGGEFHSFFCNGTDNWYQFNGAYATLSGATINTISKASGTWTADGFYTTGTRSVVVNGTEYAYTGGEGTATLTGVTPDPSAEAVGSLVVQSPRSLSASMGSVIGQVVEAHDGRLHARLDTKKSVWNYSKLDNPDDWTTGSTDGDGGTKDVESGGPLVAYGKLNQTILAFKKRVVKALSFVQSGDRVDIPRYVTLTPTDDKSTTIGAMTQRSTFATPIGMVFVTPDKRLVLLSGITANNEPQYIVLSELIQPIFDAGVHDDATGICVDDEIWYAFKSDSSSTYNDVVIRGDMTRQSLGPSGPIPITWDSPIVGWAVKDFTGVYNEETGEHEVHWHSALNSSSYKVVSDAADGGNPYGQTIRTWAETFDQPTKQKRIDRVWIEVRMSQNTEILATLLYDEDGVSGQEEHTLDGDSTNNMFANTVYNPFGFNAFGSQKFGAEPEADSLPLYRFEIPVKGNIRFFNISLELSTDDAGQEFQLVRYGYRLAEIIQETDRKYLTA